MAETTLVDLLKRNDSHVDSLQKGYFDAVQSGQMPAVVSVCCSDSRVSQEGMWDVDEPGWLFTAGNIGNQVRDRFDGEDVVSGDVLYPIRFTETTLAAVVGHTGCGAVTATLERARSDESTPLPAGIEKRVESLLPIVEAGLDDDRITDDGTVGLIDQLVEYNVDRQVEFLKRADSVPDTTTVVGFVYDFQGVYDDALGRCYLVNHDGETSLEALRAVVPDRFEDHVRRLVA
ncbi:MAG: carbonic anhydrase [Halobacteriota archaeon]|uniref:carbonic anhydrase n=1 Tax=Natronomonas sp. TaxID=2184060 RepID=UPI0039747623